MPSSTNFGLLMCLAIRAVIWTFQFLDRPLGRSLPACRSSITWASRTMVSRSVRGTSTVTCWLIRSRVFAPSECHTRRPVRSAGLDRLVHVGEPAVVALVLAQDRVGADASHNWDTMLYASANASFWRVVRERCLGLDQPLPAADGSVDAGEERQCGGYCGGPTWLRSSAMFVMTCWTFLSSNSSALRDVVEDPEVVDDQAVGLAFGG